MGRFIVALAFIAMVVAVCWGILHVFRYITRRRSQKLLAKVSPENLHHFDNIPREVVAALIQQGNELAEIEKTLRSMQQDEVVQTTLSSEHYKPIDNWLKSRQKEIS